MRPFYLGNAARATGRTALLSRAGPSSLDRFKPVPCSKGIASPSLHCKCERCFNCCQLRASSFEVIR